MAVQQRFFGKKLLSDETLDLQVSPQDAFSNIKVPSLDYTIGSDTGLLSCPPKVAQDLRMLGFDQNASASLLLAIKMLKDNAGRDINTVVFARFQKRYGVKLSILAALASLCRQEAADLGLTLRSLVRFYKRNHKAERDVPEIEQFVAWVVSRGETVKGVPTAWKEYRAWQRRK